MPTVNQYISIYSSFDPEEQSIIDLVAAHEIEIGNNYPSTDIRNKAVALLTLHWLSLPVANGDSASQTGSIKSVKEGKLSVTYGGYQQGKSNHLDPFLSQTQYGLMLISLNKACFFKPTSRAISWLNF